MAIPGLARNCRNGHRVQRGFRYCPRCGVLILTNAMFGDADGDIPAGVTGQGHAAPPPAGSADRRWAPPPPPPTSPHGVPEGWSFGPDGRLRPPWPGTGAGTGAGTSGPANGTGYGGYGARGATAWGPHARASWAVNLLGSLPPHLRRPAYTALARVLHPDAGGNAQAMQELNDAWGALEPPRP